MQIENQENFRNKNFLSFINKKKLLIKIQNNNQPENMLQPLLQPNHVSSDVIPYKEY